MRNILNIAALAAVAAFPVLASASDASAASCSSRKVNGTLIGGVGGALLGGAVTRGSTGPVVGGIGGAVLGHEIGRSGCRSRSRVAYRSSRTRYVAPEAPRPVRKVYYDQYGNPISVQAVEYGR